MKKINACKFMFKKTKCKCFHCIERPLVAVSQNLDPASMKQRFFLRLSVRQTCPKKQHPAKFKIASLEAFLGNQSL